VVSKGKRDATLIEFKLAKNTGLEKNLQHQVRIYQKASDARKTIKVILYFTNLELKRVQKILKRLELDGREDVVLIDASRKSSGSKAIAS
jgi:ATP-dependent RNA circularization protein (DNA/RNA ligase family)